jgi:hypothetical protein
VERIREDLERIKEDRVEWGATSRSTKKNQIIQSVVLHDALDCKHISFQSWFASIST